MAFQILEIQKGRWAKVRAGGFDVILAESETGPLTQAMIGDVADLCEVDNTEERKVKAWQRRVAHLAPLVSGEMFSLSIGDGFLVRQPGEREGWCTGDLAHVYQEALLILQDPRDPRYPAEVRALLEFVRGHGMAITPTQEAWLASGDYYQYTSPGSYTILYAVDSKGFCAACAVQQMANGEKVVSGTFDEGDPHECDGEGCDRSIESSYGPVDEDAAEEA